MRDFLIFVFGFASAMSVGAMITEDWPMAVVFILLGIVAFGISTKLETTK